MIWSATRTILTPRLPQRDKAIAEYKAALAHRDSQPDTKAAAEKGIKERFTLPRRTAASSDEQHNDDAPLDPSGKAEKEAYSPLRCSESGT